MPAEPSPSAPRCPWTDAAMARCWLDAGHEGWHDAYSHLRLESALEAMDDA